ncbi:TorF family putative porin [Parvularcula sp. LCG005]|uniref:TorF family putative porin n=1 Tax=Parvularcula sp. LCG005 TaxID=3078805 RepID=UPI002941D5B3|nr:TorF family putative porin [Parvularcula sp. LCG005]WOI53118.1 TorF family putative porin [Parvularcula sp. LCG005]
MNKKTLLIAAAALAAVGSAHAQDLEGFEVSGNVAFTSDYRFRGVSLSADEFAIQGGFDAAHESGFYVGTWASSIDEFAGSETELDFYAGYGFEAGGLAFDVGAISYFYPGSDDTEYYEVYGSVSGTVGVAELTGGLAYAPDQDNLGDDNVYVYADAGFPLGESPFSLGLHVGLEDGAFGDEKIDYAVSLDTSYAGLDLSAAWVDTDAEDYLGEIAEGGVVFTIGKSM